MYVAQRTVETSSDFDDERRISLSSMVKTNRNQTWACVPTPLFISPVSVTFLDHQTQESRWLVNEISITKWLFLCFLPLAVLLLMLVSSLCCSISAMKQTLKAQRRNAAVSWDELVLCLNAVYAHGQHQGLLERTLKILYYQGRFLHCLTLPSHKYHTKLRFPFSYFNNSSWVLSTPPSWRPNGVECSGYACLSKSRVDLCSTPGVQCLCAGMCVSLRYLIVL